MRNKVARSQEVFLKLEAYTAPSYWVICPRSRSCVKPQLQFLNLQEWSFPDEVFQMHAHLGT